LAPGDSRNQHRQNHGKGIQAELMEHLFFIYPDLMVKKQRYGKCTRRTGPP
jgi:hypothetical protein